MCEPSESSQLKLWLFTEETLNQCRSRANRLARIALSGAANSAGGSAAGTGSSDAAAADSSAALENVADNAESTPSLNTNTTGDGSQQPVAECFARDFNVNKDKWLKDHGSMDGGEGSDGPWQTKKGHSYVTPEEEAAIVSFYVSKLPNLIGPKAQVPRLRRESKVTATAALLLRRFYLSNSVLMFDPKSIMVAAAFLASKVEDATTDVRYLEEGTNLMDAPVSQADIIPSEIHLLSGIQFDLLCFHPYKAVLAITEDLRTYLKSEKGRSLVHFPNSATQRPIVGQDLLPMHDAAQKIVDDVIVSDIPLLYTPGQVGLAALMVANERQQEQHQQQSNINTSTDGKESTAVDVPQIDMLGYISLRFPDKDHDALKSMLRDLCTMLRELREGKHGCGNHHVDFQVLKSVHKKLKKTSKWSSSSSSNKEKKKKRKTPSTNEDGEKEGPDTKRNKP